MTADLAVAAKVYGCRILRVQLVLCSFAHAQQQHKGSLTGLVKADILS